MVVISWQLAQAHWALLMLKGTELGVGPPVLPPVNG
jgi:hypothetical protein